MRVTPSRAQLRLLLALVAEGGEGYGTDMARVVTVQACRAAGWIEYHPVPDKPFEIGKHSITEAGRRTAIDAAPAAYAERLARAASCDTPTGQ